MTFADEFRMAITSGDYELAEKLLSKQRQRITSANEARQALELLHWSLQLVSAQRAHCGSVLASLPKTVPYYLSSASPTNTWSLEG